MWHNNSHMAATDEWPNGHTLPPWTGIQSVTVIGSSFIGFLCLLSIVTFILIIQMGLETWLVWLHGGTGRTGVFIMAQSLVPGRAKVDLFPSALCVRLTWIGLWCRGQVGSELLGSQRGIKDKPQRWPKDSGRFVLVTISIQKINDFLFDLVYKLLWRIESSF